MKDRVPGSGRAGYVKLDSTSETNVYKMTFADQPSEEGTPLSKDTFLTDKTATRLWGEIPEIDPTVDDAFNRVLDTTYQVGDILTTTRTPGESWLVCDGTSFSAADWPELAAVLSEGITGSDDVSTPWATQELALPTSIVYLNTAQLITNMVLYFNGYWLILTVAYDGTSLSIQVRRSDVVSKPFAEWDSASLNTDFITSIFTTSSIIFQNINMLVVGKKVVVTLSATGNNVETPACFSLWNSDNGVNWSAPIYKSYIRSGANAGYNSFASPDKKYVFWKFEKATDDPTKIEVILLRANINGDTQFEEIIVDRLMSTNNRYFAMFVELDNKLILGIYDIPSGTSGENTILKYYSANNSDWKAFTLFSTDTYSFYPAFYPYPYIVQNNTLISRVTDATSYTNSLSSPVEWTNYNWTNQKPYGDNVLPMGLATDDEYLFIMCSQTVNESQVDFYYIVGNSITEILDKKGTKFKVYSFEDTYAGNKYDSPNYRCVFSDKFMVTYFVTREYPVPTGGPYNPTLHLSYKPRTNDLVWLPYIKLDPKSTTYIKGRSI